MKPPPERKPEELKEAIAYWRRFYDRVWLVIAAGCLLPFTAAWGFTGNREHLYPGLLGAGLCLIGLNYCHWVLLNPHRDPVKAMERIERRAAKQRRHAHSVGLLYGTIMLLLFSPFFLLLGISFGGQQYGWIGAVGGGLVGLVWTAASIAMIAWSQRQKP